MSRQEPGRHRSSAQHLPACCRHSGEKDHTCIEAVICLRRQVGDSAVGGEPTRRRGWIYSGADLLVYAMRYGERGGSTD